MMHMRTVYVNGDYLPETEAKVSIFDRGFLMADGVYEVTSVLDGKLIDFDGHAVRLQRSLCTVVLFTQNKPGLAANPVAQKGIKVISIEDIRWGRRDIKTVQLLYPSMGKMMAKAAGVDDAWMVQDGFVTEGTSNNAYIVKDGKIITRPKTNDILHGITRAAVLRFAEEAQMTVEERNFTIEEAQDADEAFITSASTFVMPVVEIDGAQIGDGKPGSVAPRLREIYLEESRKVAI